MSRLAAFAVALASVGSVTVAKPAAAAGTLRVPAITSAGDGTSDGPAPALRRLSDTGSTLPVPGRAGPASCSPPVIRGDRGCWPSSWPAAGARRRTDADLSIDLALWPRELAGADAVVVMVVANHGSAAAHRVTVTLELPADLVASGTAAGARCSGLRQVTCVIDARLVASAIEEVGPAPRPAPTEVEPARGRSHVGRGSDPDQGPDVGRDAGVGRPDWSPWRFHLYEETVTAAVAVPVRLTGPCAATWPGGPLTAAVTSPLLDLDRANNAASVLASGSSPGQTCTTSAWHSPTSIWINVYIGLIVAALATLIALSFRFRPPGRRP